MTDMQMFKSAVQGRRTIKREWRSSMRQTMTLAGILLAFALSLASCRGNNQSQQSSDLERREAELQKREDSLRVVEQQQAKQQQAEKESNSFTTSLGTLNIESVLNDCYQQGVHNGGMFGNPNEVIYDPEWRTEEKFKLFWTNNFGIPNNDKAQDVFRQGYKRYIQGWDNAVNF